MCGTNMPFESMKMDIETIDGLNSLCFKLCTQVSLLFDVKSSIKLYRTMRHVRNHIMSFGMLQWRTNDDNETSLPKQHIE